MADISKILLPNNQLYNVKDAAAVRKSGDTMTGPLVIQSELYTDSTTTGSLVATGASRFLNGLQGDLTGTIDGHTVAKDVPANAVFTDTTYSAGTGLSLNGTTFNHSNSITAGSVGTTTNTSGTSIYIPFISYDAQGHITSSGSRTHTTPDTKNTAGSTDTSSKIFLIGATSQAANPQTYSQDTAYVGTDGCLYSGGSKVLTSHQDISGKVSKTGDTMTGPLIIQNSSSSEGLIIRSQMENYPDTCCIGFDVKDIPNIPCTWYFYLDKQNNKLRISHLRRGTSTKTYFYVNSEEQDTPSFRVGADLMVGHSTTDSQGCKMRYNSTTQSLDFVFS